MLHVKFCFDERCVTSCVPEVRLRNVPCNLSRNDVHRSGLNDLVQKPAQGMPLNVLMLKANIHKDAI